MGRPWIYEAPGQKPQGQTSGEDGKGAHSELSSEATRYQTAEPRSSLEVERSRKDDAETEPGVCL